MMTGAVFNDISMALGFLSFISAIACFSIIVLSILALKMRKELRQQETLIDRMQDDLNAICSGAVGVGEHLANLQVQARDLKQRQEQLELQGSSDSSYKYALKMARNGARLEEVIEDCGIAQGEAELVFLANQMDKAS